MRRILVIIVATAMVVGGSYVLVLQMEAKQATEEVLEKAKEAVQQGSKTDSTSLSPAPTPPASGAGN